MPETSNPVTVLVGENNDTPLNTGTLRAMASGVVGEAIGLLVYFLVPAVEDQAFILAHVGGIIGFGGTLLWAVADKIMRATGTKQ